MLRFVLLVIFLMALPTVLYTAYVRVKTGGGIDDIMSKAPFLPLALSGVVLTAAVLFVYLQINRNDPGGRYVPPVYKDGKIVPGHVE
jgi:ABC-type Fe3+ transport system permease subunit